MLIHCAKIVLNPVIFIICLICLDLMESPLLWNVEFCSLLPFVLIRKKQLEIRHNSEDSKVLRSNQKFHHFLGTVLYPKVFLHLQLCKDKVTEG